MHLTARKCSNGRNKNGFEPGSSCVGSDRSVRVHLFMSHHLLLSLIPLFDGKIFFDSGIRTLDTLMKVAQGGSLMQCIKSISSSFRHKRVNCLDFDCCFSEMNVLEVCDAV